MRLRKAAAERRSSDHRNKNVSWISEIKAISNVTVRKKRGRRAPPSAKRLHGKNADKVIDSDDAVDDDISDTDKGQVGSSQSADGRTGDPDFSKTNRSGDSSDGPSSDPEEDLSANPKDIIQKATSQTTETIVENRMRSKQGKHNLKQEGVNSKPSDQNDLADMKKCTDEERSSREIKDAELSDAQLDMTSSDDKSSEEVEDVKVCDICGDVGDEDRLAVCRRCHDGAEHIYCMRVMLEEVPDSEWLCEDCETAVEFEKTKKKLEKSGVTVGTSKGQSSEGKISRPLEAAKSSSSDSESQSENVGCKESDIANEVNDMENKRTEADAMVTSSVKETVPEPDNIEADSWKKILLSRESSLKFDRDKGKQASQAATSVASSAPKNQAPVPRGPLSKSVSFNNSKVPKVKQLNEVPQKPKIVKESWSSAIKKEGAVSMTTKSATFKKPKPCEPTNKGNSSTLPTAEGPRVANPLMSQKVTTDRCASILGCPSSTATVVPPILSRAETTAQHLPSGNSMADTAHRQGGKNLLGNSELKKPLFAEGSTGILGPGAQRKIIQNSDTLHRDNKVKDGPGFRPGASNNRTIRCQRCNELGHSTQFCAIDKFSLSAIKPLSDRNLKEASNKWNSTSGTSTMVVTERLSSKSADQFVPILKCGAYQSAMPNYHRDESCQGFSTGGEQIASTLPELDYIWQGGFELWRSGRSPELCDGFQAHLSCSASQLVVDVAKKFPSKVQLEELPRQNSWPTQFQQNSPTYNNVGLFFFARDVQSYENHYSKLVENMLKNDLVLRGSVDTVELLIFPSSILSKNFQRWNMFYFLWGIFRVRRKDYSSLLPDVPKCTDKSILSEDPSALGLNASVQSSNYSFSNDINNFTKSDPNLVKSATCADNERQPSLEANHQGCLNGTCSLNQPVAGTALHKSHDYVTARCSTGNNDAIDHSASTTEKNNQKLNYSEQDEICGTINGNVSERYFDMNMVPDDCSMPSIHEEPDKESKTINLDDTEQLMDVDHANTVTPNTGALDSISHASGGVRKRDFEMVNGADEVDGALKHKKMKLDNVVAASSGSCEITNDGRLSSKVHPLSASSVDGTGNKPMASTDGKCVFPVDLNAVSGDLVNIPSSDDEDFSQADVQGREKETGVDRPSGKAILSSHSPKAGEMQNFGGSLPTDITGSLSLSLGFSSRKEQ
ncbi:hypothetical protein QOZ80_5AG0389010 [Eleusine coracana subsp. coracana]|nr:hypothetical protein QOZ80_5AG0389010 [Eleusine coracana subsp. coracana]